MSNDPDRQCRGAGFGRFQVIAGPDPCADRSESVAEFLAESSRFGITAVGVQTSDRTRFTFEVEAESPERACERVTTLLRSVYGMNWWADVTSLCSTRSPQALAAAWN